MTTMVDSKIGKSFQKSVGRAKEKLLQNLGKVDRTADEILDEHIGNFNKQQGAATRLQKELNNYIRCIRACAAASRSLLESVSEVYEPEWGGKELLSVNSQSVELLWNDFAHRLAEQVLIPLNTYQGQFPEMRKKIEKRSRKLIDFDGERHALQALQANPRRAEAKLAKQRESLEAAKRTYEVLNSELHEELPSLYNSRIVFLVSAMSTLFASEHIFHSETSKVFTELEGIVDRLSKESAKGNLNFKVPSNAIINHTGGSDSPKDVKGGNTPSCPVSPVSKSSSNPATPEQSPASPPTSLNIPSATPTTTLNDEQPVTSNNKVTPTEASNTLTSSLNSNGSVGPSSDEPNKNNPGNNGSADTPPPVIASNNTPSSPKTENIPSASSDTTTTKDKTLVNGGTSDEVTPESIDKNEPGKVATMNVDAMTSDAKKTQDDNNNDLNASSSGRINEIKDSKRPIINGGHDLTKDAAALALAKNETSESIDVVGKSNENDVSNNGPVATAPSRGISKPLHGILSQSKHANGEISDSPTKESNSGDSKEPGVLYRVRATYRYVKEDVDELSFEAGEIIRVIEYEEPEEQEEGWLMGVKENGEKGLFPANFTRPI